MLKFLSQKLNAERQLLLVLTGLCGMTLLINFIQNLYFLNTIREELPRSIPLILLEDFLLNALILAGFCAFILFFTNLFFRKEVKTLHVFSFHLLASVLSGLFAYFLALSASLVFGSLTIEIVSSYNHTFRIISEIDSNFLAYFSILSIVYIYHYYRQYRESEFQKYEINNKLTISNLNLIKSQLEPHFLFNTLNAVSSLIYTDKEKATNTITNLGDVLRETLMLRDTQFITVESEISYLEKYVDILKIRFEDQINYHVKVEEKVKEVQIPALLLQPLVENAIKHGLKNGKDAIHLLVDISLNKKKGLALSIKNSGKYLDENRLHPSADKKGIDIIKDRLSLIYGSEFDFSLRNILDPVYKVEAVIYIQHPQASLADFKEHKNTEAALFSLKK